MCVFPLISDLEYILYVPILTLKQVWLPHPPHAFQCVCVSLSLWRCVKIVLKWIHRRERINTVIQQSNSSSCTCIFKECERNKLVRFSIAMRMLAQCSNPVQGNKNDNSKMKHSAWARKHIGDGTLLFCRKWSNFRLVLWYCRRYWYVESEKFHFDFLPMSVGMVAAFPIKRSFGILYAKFNNGRVKSDETDRISMIFE